eukprot:CAMPEP_0176440044 /NCGR_PEP_ID=MMETSP0127-20121128/20325_1 /TAXON_ID=938130 /ORGANISM="Platyophrya macrostoma, Strain WH" /LENGTH=147 /DNA_ID=CAMNT_0017824471 /DNA_START=34 /DNA_END=477 /DNA_ORIENTATION=-
METHFKLRADGTEKSSVRVHNPSGGKSTFSLGWGNDMVEEKPTNKQYRNQSSIFGGEEPTSKPFAEKKTVAPTTTMTTEPTKTSVKVHYAPGGQSSGIFGGDSYAAPEKKENIKPQNMFEPTQQVVDTKTSVRVRNPPGGKSTFSLF